MRIWFAIVSLAVAAAMLVVLIVTTIAAGIMCPGYANPLMDAISCVVACILLVVILITIWNLMRIKKGFKSRFK